jgi:hypothetical protein
MWHQLPGNLHARSAYPLMWTPCLQYCGFFHAQCFPYILPSMMPLHLVGTHAPNSQQLSKLRGPLLLQDWLFHVFYIDIHMFTGITKPHGTSAYWRVDHIRSYVISLKHLHCKLIKNIMPSYKTKLNKTTGLNLKLYNLTHFFAFSEEGC